MADTTISPNAPIGRHQPSGGANAPNADHSRPSGDAPGDIAAQTAFDQEGKMYQWGGKGPDNFDCSGLVSYALDKAGLLNGYKTSQDLANVGNAVPINDMKAGDIVIYNGGSHVGLCLGGQPPRVVHASETGKPIVEGGQDVGGNIMTVRRATGGGEPSGGSDQTGGENHTNGGTDQTHTSDQQHGSDRPHRSGTSHTPATHHTRHHSHTSDAPPAPDRPHNAAPPHDPDPAPPQDPNPPAPSNPEPPAPPNPDPSAPQNT